LEELTPELRRVVAAGRRASPRRTTESPLLAHPTDRAVVEGAQRAGVAVDEDVPGWRQVAELPFEPSRGYHAVLGAWRDGQLVSVKGAPETVLARCRTWRHNGSEVPFDARARAQVEHEVNQLARRGYRVLAVAERPASDRKDLHPSRIKGLTLVGLLALADPIRPTAARAVEALRGAGVDIVMITGDHPSTAEAIAAELNALNGRQVMTGPELDAMDDDELAGALSGIAVFARVSPEQKARIIRALRRAGRRVAVTGDGANDAPAIRLADIGIALGTRATPAAREAADVVVTDDRIETITDAVVEGRAMWSSVRDGLAILLGGNLGEIGFTLGAGLLGAETLNVRQLLMLNLFTDVVPAMAVAVRPPPHRTADVLLAEGPDRSLGSALTRDVAVRAVATAGAANIAWLAARLTAAGRRASTTALVALVCSQLGQTVTLRGRTPLVLISSLATLGALAVVVQTPGLSQFCGCTPLWPHQWAFALGAATATTGAVGLATPLLNAVTKPRKSVG
jgi:cation-transporting ATPase I